MSERVYKAVVFGETPPDELLEWTLAEKFGWTLEYIAELPEGRVMEWYAIQDGKAHAGRSILK